MSSEVWARTRIYIVFLRKDVYGVADAGFLAKTYKDLIAKQRQVAPKKLGDVLPERALEDIPPGGVQRSIFEDSDLASRRWKVDSKAFRSSLGVSENYKEEVVPGSGFASFRKGLGRAGLLCGCRT